MGFLLSAVNQQIQENQEQIRNLKYETQALMGSTAVVNHKLIQEKIENKCLKMKENILEEQKKDTIKELESIRQEIVSVYNLIYCNLQKSCKCTNSRVFIIIIIVVIIVTFAECTASCIYVQFVYMAIRNLRKKIKFWNYPVNISLFKVNRRNARKMCVICSKLTIKTPERRQWLCSGVFIVNFEHISQLFLVFLRLTLNSYNICVVMIMKSCET